MKIGGEDKMLEKKNKNAILLCRKYHFKGSEKDLALLRLLCHISKNIYNATLYKLRELFFNGNELPTSYFGAIPLLEIGKIDVKDKNGKDKKKKVMNLNYSTLNTFMSNEVVADTYSAAMNYITYFDNEGNMKEEYKDTKDEDWIKNRKLPRYLPKNGYYQISTSQIQKTKNNHYLMVPLSNSVRKAKNNIFSDDINDDMLNKFISEYKKKYNKAKRILIKIPDDIINKTIQDFKIIPINDGKDFNIVISYEEDIPELKNKLGDKEMGIDLGVNVLMACAVSNGEAFLIDGKKHKEILSLGKRDYSRAQAKLPRIKKGSPYQIGPSKYMKNVFNKTKRRSEAYLNCAVALLFKLAIEKGITKIYVGWNKGLQNGGLKNDKMSKKIKRKKNNFFCRTPFRRLIEKIKCKGLRLGIEVLEVNESYTSLKSFFDGDTFDNEICSGKRIRRGLYKTKSGKIVHADINAAFNILAKCSSLNLDEARHKGYETVALRIRPVL